MQRKLIEPIQLVNLLNFVPIITENLMENTLHDQCVIVKESSFMFLALQFRLLRNIF